MPKLISISIVPQHPAETEADFLRLYDDLATALGGRSASCPLQEKVFAEASAHDALKRARRRVFEASALDPELPFTFVGVRPSQGGRVAGLQITALTGGLDGIRQETVWNGSRAVGRRVEGDCWRSLFLTAVRGCDGSTSQTPAQEIDEMFRRSGALAKAQDFDFLDTERTWIYMDRLLEHYDDLNAVRNDFFEEIGVGTRANDGRLPASTGIGAEDLEAARCFMDLALFRSSRGDGPGSSRSLGSLRQSEASDYGSAFARARTVELDDSTLLYVSGTASIGADGETLHVGDSTAQCREAFDAVAEILRSEGATWEHVTTGVLFLKNAEAAASHRALRAADEVPALPLIQIYADICRDDLLVELEVTALLPRRT